MFAVKSRSVLVVKTFQFEIGSSKAKVKSYKDKYFFRFSETDAFVVQVCGEAISSAPKTRIDAYADAFEAFERGSEFYFVDKRLCLKTVSLKMNVRSSYFLSAYYNYQILFVLVSW